MCSLVLPALPNLCPLVFPSPNAVSEGYVSHNKRMPGGNSEKEVRGLGQGPHTLQSSTLDRMDTTLDIFIRLHFLPSTVFFQVL